MKIKTFARLAKKASKGDAGSAKALLELMSTPSKAVLEFVKPKGKKRKATRPLEVRKDGRFRNG